MMKTWISFDTDRGGVLWGVLCCWVAVLGNGLLLTLAVPIFYLVPWNVFGVPLLVSLLMAAARRFADMGSSR